MRVAIMRPRDRLQESCALAEGMGFEVISASPIDIQVRDSAEFDDFLDALRRGRVDVVMFSSATAVQSSLELAARRGCAPALIGGLQGVAVVAIGPATARRLAREGVEAEGMPEEFTSRGLVAYARERDLAGRKCFVLRSDHGAIELLPGLREAGLEAVELIVYSLRQESSGHDMEAIFAAGERGEVDAFLFTSSLSARTFVEGWAERLGMEGALRALTSTKVAAIGPPTRSTLESYGVRVDVMPPQATFDCLLRAVRASLLP